MSQPAKQAKGPEFYEIQGWRRVASWPFVLLVRLWCRSLRMELDAAGQAALRDLPPGAMFILWHNRLFAGAEFHRRYRSRYARVAGLISASKDGAWLSAFFGAFGMQAVRGSSGRRGTEGAREMLAILNGKIDAGITVDGSKGPVYEAKEGAMMLARRTGRAPHPPDTDLWGCVALEELGPFLRSAAFSRVRFELETYANIEAFAPGTDRKEATALLTQRLRQLAQGTDAELGL